MVAAAPIPAQRVGHHERARFVLDLLRTGARGRLSPVTRRWHGAACDGNCFVHRGGSATEKLAVAFVGASARKAKSTDTPTGPVAEIVKADDDLQSEEREANPLSETVTLTLSISPPVKAVVMWGS